MTRKSGFDIRNVLQVPLNTREMYYRLPGYTDAASRKTSSPLVPREDHWCMMAMNRLAETLERTKPWQARWQAALRAIENATVTRSCKNHGMTWNAHGRAWLLPPRWIWTIFSVVVTELELRWIPKPRGTSNEHQGDLWRKFRTTRALFAAILGCATTWKEHSGQVFQTGEPALINNPIDNPVFQTV
jgi:hypothetical protein